MATTRYNSAGTLVSITNDTPIAEFPKRKVSTVSFTTASNSGIPYGNGAGTFSTYRINDDDVLNYQMFVPFNKSGIALRYWTASGWENRRTISFDDLTKLLTTGWTITDSYAQNPNDLNFRYGNATATPIFGLDRKKNIKHNFTGNPGSVEGADLFGAVTLPVFTGLAANTVAVWAQTIDGVTRLRARNSDGKIVDLGTPTVTTATRPTTAYDGQQVYDTTIKKPIWYDGTATVWKDAMGNPV